VRGRGLTYADAARLLGGGGDALVRALDAALGGVLLVATAGTSELAISLFDAKSELTRLSEKLAVTLGQRGKGLGRVDRSERMAAAHAVVVVTAFFEAVREADLAYRDQVIRLERREQAAIASGRHVSGNQLGDLADALFISELPPLSPTMTLRKTAAALESYYAELGERLRLYITGLAVWDAMSAAEREDAEARLVRQIPADAVERWRIAFRRLAVEFPELGFYIDRADHEATRDELRQIRTGLAALQTGLANPTADHAEGTRAGLGRRYQAELDRPILDSDEVPTDVVLPTLREGYLDPDYRAADAEVGDRLQTEQFWAAHPVHDDLDGFLFAHFTSAGATERPLLILGQPGAGKSVLTKIVAGKLPEQDFLVVRVVLRQVPADVDLQTQIEDAVRAATGEQLSWPVLSRTGGGALRVVLLDGLDELLQSTGVGQSNYLTQVAAFQQREADQDRAVAVVVTSRMAVADRAQLPAPGAVVVRLEPFRPQQINRWIEVWNQRNAAGLARRGLTTLPTATALEHSTLAEQPLLLLMLALYDADANGLQQAAGQLNTPDLYERLLELFARREVTRNHPAHDPAAIATAVQTELHRLSMTAIAMFNRGRQWVTQAELDADLHTLMPAPATNRTDFRTPVTLAADTIGRFFFIHRSQSRRGGQELTAVEFLHATFGEYLVARLVHDELKTLLAVSELDLTGLHTAALNPDLLLDLIAFTPLTTRDTVITTLKTRLDELPPRRRTILRDLLIRMFRATVAGTAGSSSGYQPVLQSPAARQALQSLNLLVLVAITGDVTARELFGIDDDPIAAWRSTALLWYGQCTEEGWQSVVVTLTITRLGDRSNRDLQIGSALSREWAPEPINPLWSVVKNDPRDRFFDGSPPFGWAINSTNHLQLTGAFLHDQLTNHLLHAIDAIPIGQHGFVNSYASTRRTGEATSAIHALTELWLASAEGNRDRLAEAYDHCLSVGRWAFGPGNWSDRELFVLLVLRQAAADQDSFPQALRTRMAEWYGDLVQRGELPHASEEPLHRWAQQVIHGLDGA
jgi:NACHT N-terminal Helical domain 7